MKQLTAISAICLLMLATCTPASAMDGNPELRQARQELRQQRKEVRETRQLLAVQMARLELMEQAVEELLPEPELIPAVPLEVQDWAQGYIDQGGQNLDVFISTILPCETNLIASGEWMAGPTNDHGRAQINLPTWRSQLERAGMPWSQVYDDYTNGRMAAYVEANHHGVRGRGLTAWTCYR